MLVHQVFFDVYTELVIDYNVFSKFKIFDWIGSQSMFI